MIFPQARTCIFTVLAWARNIRIARPIPESAPNAPQEAVEAPVAVPVRGNCQILKPSGYLDPEGLKILLENLTTILSGIQIIISPKMLNLIWRVQNFWKHIENLNTGLCGIHMI